MGKIKREMAKNTDKNIAGFMQWAFSIHYKIQQQRKKWENTILGFLMDGNNPRTIDVMFSVKNGELKQLGIQMNPEGDLK